MVTRVTCCVGVKLKRRHKVDCEAQGQELVKRGPNGTRPEAMA